MATQAPISVLDLSDLSPAERERVMRNIHSEQPNAQLTRAYRVSVSNEDGIAGRISGSDLAVKVCEAA